MANVRAGVVGSVDMGLGDHDGPVPTSKASGVTKDDAAFWTLVVFVAAAGFLILTYFGGFRRLG